MENAQKTPLIDLLRGAPLNLRAQWEIQWADDGRPTGHAVSPVGRLMHEAANEIERLTKQNGSVSVDSAFQQGKKDCTDGVPHQAGRGVSYDYGYSVAYAKEQQQ